MCYRLLLFVIFFIQYMKRYYRYDFPLNMSTNDVLCNLTEGLSYQARMKPDNVIAKNISTSIGRGK